MSQQSTHVALGSTNYNIQILIRKLPEHIWLGDVVEDPFGLQPVRAARLFHNDSYS